MARRRRRRRWGLVELAPPRMDFRRAELRDALTNRMSDGCGNSRGAEKKRLGARGTRPSDSPLRGLAMKRRGDFEVRLSMERSEDIPVRWARMTVPKCRPECRR